MREKNTAPILKKNTETRSSIAPLLKIRTIFFLSISWAILILGAAVPAFRFEDFAWAKGFQGEIFDLAAIFLLLFVVTHNFVLDSPEEEKKPGNGRPMG